MRRQFILTIWIVLLCHQIHCAPTDATSAESQPQDDEYYDDEFEPIVDLGDLDGAEPKGKKQSGESGGADPSAKSGADTPEVNKPGAGPAETKEKPEQAEKKPDNPTPAEKKPEEPTDKKPENGVSGETPVKEPQGAPETAAGKGKDQKSSGNKGFKNHDQRQAEKDARRSKWQLPKKKLTGPETEQPKNTGKPNLQRSKPTTKGDKFAKSALALVDKKPVTVAGSISDLLSAVGQRVNSFEDINKKLLPPPPRSKGISGRSVGPKLGAQSLPLTGKSLPLTGKSLSPAPKSIPSLTRSVPTLGTKSLPGEEPPRGSGYDDDNDDGNYRLSPFARRKQAERLQKLYGSQQPAASSPSRPAKTINAKPLTSNAGTEEYEKLLARRGRQLDELEEDKPTIATKSLPARLKSVSGTFDDIASQLSENISGVSAVNKDKLRSPKMKVRAGPVTINPDSSSEEETDPKMTRRAGRDPCPCYNKYSPLNVVRRTTKRVVRAVKTGTNMLYDVADAGLDKSKDLKDATRNDLVDPVVNILPLVSPVVTGVLDAGDAVVDGTISGAKAAVQGGKNLNEGFYNGIEGMLKKDKSCRCAEDAAGI